MSAEGDVALNAMLEHLRGLKSLPEDIARAAAADLQEAARATAAAGKTPDGDPWQPKKDGGRALVHAAEHLVAKALGKTIVLTLKGVEVFHNFGTSRLPKRQILPDGGSGIPKNVSAALRKTAGRVFSRAMGGTG